MGATETTLQILIKATDQSAGVLSGAGDRISALGEGAKKVSEPFASVATAVAKIDTALAALVGGSLALAISESGKFSGQFAEITTLFDAPASGVEKFRADILRFAQDSKSSIDDINAAVYSAISAGASYKDSLSLVEQAEKTAIAGKAGLNDATVLLSSSLNAYGASVNQAADFSDALFVAVKDGQTTLPELAASLAQVTGVAAQAGVSYSDLLSALAALTASGLPTSQAVTAIKGALTNILKPTSDAQKTAKALGLEFNSTALASKGLGGFMAELKDRTGGNIDAMSSLFGSVEGLNGALILTGTGAEKFSQVLEDMKNRAGATSAAYEKMAQEFDQINQNLANNVKVILIDVGDKVKNDYANLIGALVDVFKSLEAAVQNGAFNGLFNMIDEAFKRAEGALKNIAQNLPDALSKVDFSGLIGSVNGLAGALSGLFGGIDLTTPAGLAAALQKAVDSLASLIDFSKGIVDGLRPFLTAVGEAIDKFNNLDEGTKQAAGGLTGLMTSVNLLAGPLSSLGDGIGTLGVGLTSIAGSNLAGTVAGLAGSGGLAAAFSAVSTAASGFLAALSGPAGVVAAFAAVGVGLGAIINSWWDYKKANDVATDAQERAEKSAAALAEKYQAISDKTGVTIKSTRDLTDAVADGKIHFDEATKSWEAGAAPLKTLDEKINQVAESGATYSKWLKENTDEQGNLVGALSKSTSAVNDQVQALAAYYESLGNSPAVARFMAEAEDGHQTALKKTGEALDKTTKKSDDYYVQLLKIASDERTKTIETEVKFNIAQLEASVEKSKVLFGSIDNAVNNTSMTITSLFDDLRQAGTGSQKWGIEDQIQKEDERRKQEFDLQKKLVEQQIELNDIRIKNMRDGKGLISVQLDQSVSPALEMVLQEFVKHLQVWVDESADAYLLATGGA